MGLDRKLGFLSFPDCSIGTLVEFACPACGALVVPDAKHFSSACSEAAPHLRGAMPNQFDLFAKPMSAQMFRAQLACVAVLTTPCALTLGMD